jgi:CMP-N-acetylneuraminic acid synthetase
MKICIIPARKGSKRLPYKNMMDLNGKPLVQWTIEQARESNLFDMIIVSTDWYDIIELAIELDVDYRHRTPELDTDEATAQDVIIDAIEFNLPFISEEDNLYCLLQPTSPLRQAKDIRRTLDAMCKEDNSLFTINEQTLKPNGLIYWFRDYKDMWKRPVNVYFTYGPKNLDIDYLWDFRVAEYFLKYRR